jgi:hypothetical protein
MARFADGKWYRATVIQPDGQAYLVKWTDQLVPSVAVLETNKIRRGGYFWLVRKSRKPNEFARYGYDYTKKRRSVMDWQISRLHTLGDAVGNTIAGIIALIALILLWFLWVLFVYGVNGLLHGLWQGFEAILSILK